VARNLDRLKRIWIIRSDKEHREARQFLATTWAGYGWRDMREKFDECEKRVEILRKKNDFYTMMILVKTNQEAVSKILAQLGSIQNPNDEQTQQIADMQDLVERLREMHKDLVDFIATASSAP